MRAPKRRALFEDRRQSRARRRLRRLGECVARNRAQCRVQNFQSSNRGSKQLCASVCVSELVTRPGEDNRRRPAALRDQERVCERARSIAATALPKYRPAHTRPVPPIRRAAIAFSFPRRCRVRSARCRARAASRYRVHAFSESVTRCA